MRRLLFAVPLLFAVAAHGQTAVPPSGVVPEVAARTPNLAGKVDLVEDGVTVYDKAKKARSVGVGDAVYEGEGIATGKDGELHLNMEDGGYIAVRPTRRCASAPTRRRARTTTRASSACCRAPFGR